MEFDIDRSSGVPIRRQLRGMIEYGIACGELPIGAALPSVRELAEHLGVAPMTVSQVYGALKKDGLIEGRSGSGTFVADSLRAQMATRPELDVLHADIDRLIDYAEAVGLRGQELTSLINSRLAHRNAAGRRRDIVMVGLFAEATESYAECVARQLGDAASVRAVTLSALEDSAEARTAAGAADLILSFSPLRGQIAAMFPNTKVVALRFIPAEETRMSLASLDPMARVAVVSKFVAFQPVIHAGVHRFAPHVLDIVTLNADAPDAARTLADRDVVIYATGADGIARHAAPGAQAIEFRHTPDPRDIDRVVRPFVAGEAAAFPAKRKAAT